MEINVILANYIEVIKQIYGSNIEKIILLGSYARGDNDVEINPMTHSKELFYKWVDNYPFFNNIEKEGIVLYAA